MTINLDAARAARLGAKKKGPKVVYEGKTYVLAPELPFSVLEMFVDLVDENAAGPAIVKIARTLLGEHAEAFSNMSTEDLNVLLEGIMAEYGVTAPLPSTAS